MRGKGTLGGRIMTWAAVGTLGIGIHLIGGCAAQDNTEDGSLVAALGNADVTYEGEDAGAGCSLTQGYWKNHNSYAKNRSQQIPWPIAGAEDRELCGRTWLEILNESTRGDAWVILAHQWIAAFLNVSSGASIPAEAFNGLGSAYDMLASCEISAEDREAALAISETLDSYNNGNIGPGHCE